MQRLFSCPIGFTFHEIKINDLPESSSDHTSISAHLKEWCDLLRIFLHPLPYFPFKMNKEIHCNFFWKSTIYQDQSVALKETGPRIKQEHNSTISKTKEQMDYKSTVTGHLATNEVATKKSTRRQPTRHQVIRLPGGDVLVASRLLGGETAVSHVYKGRAKKPTMT